MPDPFDSLTLDTERLDIEQASSSGEASGLQAAPAPPLRQAYRVTPSQLFAAALKLAADIRAELLKTSRPGQRVPPERVLAYFIGMSGVQGHFVNPPDELVRLPSHTACPPGPYVRTALGARYFLERSMGRPIREKAEKQSAATGAYRAFDPKCCPGMSETLFGSVKNPVTQAHWLAARAAGEPELPPDQPADRRPCGDPIWAPPQSAAAHDTMLNYKFDSGRLLAEALSDLPVIGVACTNGYPAVVVGIRNGALPLPLSKAGLAVAPTAQRELAELSMYLFMGLANAWGCNRRHEDHMEMSQRQSFGFPTPSVSFIDSNFRISLPFAPPRYLQGLHFALSRLDGLLGSLFQPAAPATAAMQASLQRAKQALLRNLRLDGDLGDPDIWAYYGGLEDRGGAAQIRAAIEKAGNFGELLVLSVEKPRGNAITLKTLAGSLVRAAGPALAGLVMNHPGEEYLALERVISQVHLQNSHVSYVPIRASKGLGRPASYPTPPVPFDPQVLAGTYAASMQRVTMALGNGLARMAGSGFEPRALELLRAMVGSLGHLPGHELQQAWDCIEALMTAGVAHRLAHMPHAADLDLNHHNDSDSDLEFDGATGTASVADPDADADGVRDAGAGRIVSKKITTHNGMQAIILGVIAANELLRDDEYFITRTTMRNMYYETFKALPNLDRFEPGLAHTMAYGSTALGKQDAAEAMDLHQLVENTFQTGATRVDPFETLAASDKRIWHLDVTGTTEALQARVVELFGHKNEAQVMILVSSGLKHQQFSATNPYGTVRVFVKGNSPAARHRLDALMQSMRSRINPMSTASHELRRAYRACGMVPTGPGMRDAISAEAALRSPLGVGPAAGSKRKASGAQPASTSKKVARSS